MKKSIIFLIYILVIQVLYSNENIKFSELYLEHDTKTGKTEIILFNVIGGLTTIQQVNKTEFIKSNYELPSYELLAEEFSTSKEILSVRIKLKAIDPVLHQKNIEEILSQLLVKEVSVKDIEVEPFIKYIIGIVIENIEEMYFPNGNCLGIYGSKDNTTVLCQFDIGHHPIKFLAGYKK